MAKVQPNQESKQPLKDGAEKLVTGPLPVRVPSELPQVETASVIATEETAAKLDALTRHLSSNGKPFKNMLVFAGANNMLLSTLAPWELPAYLRENGEAILLVKLSDNGSANCYQLVKAYSRYNSNHTDGHRLICHPIEEQPNNNEPGELPGIPMGFVKAAIVFNKV
ncbi:MAG: hypothetical protein EOP56_15050 [Sphingobacteriales bacterium]|nr:MAG: hypothetical protein EOP56_15050 [Sphingobacteriales bacterium]